MNVRKRQGPVVASCCAAALLFAGCASPGGGSAASSQGVASLPSIGRAAASATNLAGQYQGTFRLKTKVVGKAYFTLTQSGTTVGGTLKLVLSKKTLHEPVAVTFDAASNGFSGNVVDPTGKTPCTYAIAGSYNPKTFVLRGTSSPLTCAGKVANFTTTESCYYNTGTGAGAIRRDARGIIEC